MPSIRDVATRAGVSLGTVSNVLNHPEVVALSTRERVLAVIQELGFIRNGSAHQLRSGGSQHIGLLVLDIANPFFTEVARGVEDAANEAGYVVILCNSDDSAEKELRYLRVLEEQRTAGILITPVQDDTRYLQRLRHAAISVVLLDRPDHTDDESHFCSIAVDDLLGGELATRHLLDLGHRRIAFVSGPLSIRQCAERRAGMVRAIEAADLRPEQVIVDIPVGAQNATAGEKCVELLLQHAPRPTATFCANDLLALGLMRGLRQHGISIPQQMALIGYDDVEFAQSLSPALTSVRQPKYLLGYTATELLLNEVNASAQHQHKQIIYPPELIIRASTLPPPV